MRTKYTFYSNSFSWLLCFSNVWNTASVRESDFTAHNGLMVLLRICTPSKEHWRLGNNMGPVLRPREKKNCSYAAVRELHGFSNL